MSDDTPVRLSAHALDELYRCPRKFALRYLHGAFWPGTPPEERDEPVGIAVGQAFHLVVQVAALGLDPEPSLDALADAEGRLQKLWRAFERSPHREPPAGARVWTEQQLNFFLGGMPFNVRYDRLQHHEGRWTILDWKTGRIDERVAGSWQTRLYRLALVEAGAALGLGPVLPEDVTLLYWEVERGEAYALPYDAASHEADRQALLAEVARVRTAFNAAVDDDPHYPRNERHCPRCTFHSLCRREAIVPAASQGPRLPRFALE